ncbi:MAG: TIGR02285 family protein [Bdellovibrio sp.]|nr:TIGR02285 family protein [Bdellovibrio sp.]
MVFIFSLLTILASQAHAAPERVVWNKPNWPPYYITEGPRTGQGHLDKLFKLVQNQAPHLQFTPIKENSIKDFRGGPNERFCNSSFLRTKERDKTAYFTAFYLQPPVQIIVRKETWKKPLYEAKVLPFKRLIDVSLRGVFAKARSYGDYVNSVLKEQKKNPHVSYISNTGESLSLLTIVDLGRADYTLEYPEVLRYMEQEKLIKNDLVTIEIEEQRTPYVVYISCPRNDWGKNIISILDQAVQKAASMKEFKTLMEEWYPADVRTRYRKDFDEFYKKRSSSSWTTVPLEKK